MDLWRLGSQQQDVEVHEVEDDSEEEFEVISSDDGTVLTNNVYTKGACMLNHDQ